MIEVSLQNTFKNFDTGEDIYLLSIKMSDNNVYTIPCTKDEFETIHTKIKTIYNNEL